MIPTSSSHTALPGPGIRERHEVETWSGSGIYMVRLRLRRSVRTKNKTVRKRAGCTTTVGMP